ncbi:MAG: hypothetical protein ACLUBQ_11440 [Roseburia inulinivorans]
MMGRLIDADELKKYLKKYLHYGHAIPWVDAQPTAYDPDKVVEQLEKLKSLVPVNRVLDDIVNDKPKELGMLIAYNKAIEIVKSSEQEQKSECEWKLEDAESNLYVTGCENRQLIFEGTPEENGYKYCPYCGRKIKRGGIDG